MILLNLIYGILQGVMGSAALVLGAMILAGAVILFTLLFAAGAFDKEE